MNQHYEVFGKDAAWALANDLFPTDYEYDSRCSQNAGYPIYYSTAFGVNAWISDLNTCLELNLPDGSSIRVNIKQPFTAVKDEFGKTIAVFRAA